jgi:sec-independent protein translocase protein TatB
MFDFGFWELALVGVVALLVVGPNRLPGLARQVGTWIGNTKRFVNTVRADIEREFQSEELKRMLNEQQNEIRQLKGLISDTQSELGMDVQGTDHLSRAIEEQVVPDMGQSEVGDKRTDRGAQAAPQLDSATSDNDARRSRGS